MKQSVQTLVFGYFMLTGWYQSWGYSTDSRFLSLRNIKSYLYIYLFLLYTHATSAWVIKVTFKINNRVCQYIIVEWLTISGAREITKNLGLDIDITCDGSWHECSDSCSNSSGLSSTWLAIRVIWFLVLINISLLLRLPLSLYVLRQ